MSALAVWRLVKPFLPYIAAFLALVGAYLWIDHRGYQRGFHKRDAEIATAQAAAAKQEAENAEKARKAADDYATKVAAMQPIVIRSIDKVKEYAQTPAGRAECLSAERVSSILQDRAALAAASAGSGGPVQAGSDPAAQPDQR